MPVWLDPPSAPPEAKRSDVGGTRAFTQHLLDRVAGHDMDQEEDDGDDEPQHGQRVTEAHQQ